MERSQNLACQQILLKCQCLSTRIALQERINKSTLPGRRFKKTANFYATLPKCISQSIYHRRRCVECCQNRCFQRVHVSRKLLVILGIVMDKAMQFNRRSEQLNIRFAPLGSVCKLIGIVEYALQPTESGIFAQCFTLNSVRRSLLNTEAKRDTNSLNVVAHGL